MIAARNYRNVKSQLKKKNIENKNLSSLVKEYQTDQNMALEHLTAAKDRKLKSARIAHAKWRDGIIAKHAKCIEEIKTTHAEELKLISEQLQEIKDVKWSSAAAMADMDKKHRAATASSISAVKKNTWMRWRNVITSLKASGHYMPTIPKWLTSTGGIVR